MTRRQAVGWLILVCLIWGASFTVIKETLALISPLLLMGLKFGLAAMLVIGSFRGLSRYELLGGMMLGLFFWGGMAFQTFGLDGTTPSPRLSSLARRLHSCRWSFSWCTAGRRICLPSPG